MNKNQSSSLPSSPRISTIEDEKSRRAQAVNLLYDPDFDAARDLLKIEKLGFPIIDLITKEPIPDPYANSGNELATQVYDIVERYQYEPVSTIAKMLMAKCIGPFVEKVRKDMGQVLGKMAEIEEKVTKNSLREEYPDGLDYELWETESCI